MELINTGLFILNCVGSTTILVFFATFMIFMYLTRREARVPPGPPLVPILGNLLSLASKDVLNNLAQLRRQYGDIYALYFGKELTIFLNGYDAINDALLRKGSLFARRPETPFTKSVNIYPGIVAANGHLWKEQRAFTQRTLQLLCFKNKSGHIEEIIIEEAKKLLYKFEIHGSPVDPKQWLSVSIANVISNFLLSKSFDLEDEEFRGFLKHVDNVSDHLPRLMTIINCFPFLTKIPWDVLRIKNVFSSIYTWERIFNKYTSKRGFDGEKNDFVELYMQQMAENESLGVTQTFTEHQMAITSFDLVIAGSETTSTTISWLLLYILNDTELETRLYSEINDVIGNIRSPSLDDRSKMPYTEATILETLRITTVAPLGVPHSVPRDVIFRGYLFPKDTTIATNLHSIMMDPKLWPEPDKFKPERFLSPDQKTLDIPKEFIPFSLGPRSCLGETLAKMEIFLYLTSILQRFRLSPFGSEIPSLKGKLGVVYHPPSYQICLIKR